MEMQKDYASKGAAYGIGIPALVAGGLALVQNGGLGNLFGNGAVGCSENTPVTRYELGQAQKIATLETEVKLRDANFYTINEISNLRNYVDGRFTNTDRVLAEQAVHNATQNGVISCLSSQIQSLQGLTKLVIPNDSVCPGWGPVCTETIPCNSYANVVAKTTGK